MELDTQTAANNYNRLRPLLKELHYGNMITHGITLKKLLDALKEIDFKEEDVQFRKHVEESMMPDGQDELLKVLNMLDNMSSKLDDIPTDIVDEVTDKIFSAMKENGIETSLEDYLKESNKNHDLNKDHEEIIKNDINRFGMHNIL